jgi:hypothetical protein
MKLKIVAALLPLVLVLGPAAPASAGKDRLRNFLTSAVFSDPAYRAKLPAGVRYYFADEPAAVKRVIGPTRTNKRTAATSKGDLIDCRWAMLSALIAIGQDARAQGGNAVVGIKSNFKGEASASRETFQCGVGGMMVGVALIGDVAVVD